MSLASRFNLAYLSAGIYCEEQLTPSDSSACLHSILEQHWRARTEEQACQLMKEFVDRWREATRIFTEYEYQFDDFGERLKCREAFIYNLTTKPFRSHSERRQWAEQWLRNWHREKSTDPATIAQQYLRRQQDWFDKPRAGLARSTLSRRICLWNVCGSVCWKVERPYPYTPTERSGDERSARPIR